MSTGVFQMMRLGRRSLAGPTSWGDTATGRDRVVLRLLGGVLLVLGVIVLARTIRDFDVRPLDYRLVVLTSLALVSAGYRVKVPGRPVSVGISEVFVFATLILFGTTVATLMVAFIAVGLAYVHSRQPLHRLLFTLAEPVVSIWTAGQAFTLSSGALHGIGPAAVISWVPVMTMAAVYLFVNTQLRSFLLAAETGGSARAAWREHVPILGINYCAAASLAALGVSGGANLSLAVIGMAVPLLALSYVAHREAASRVDQADRHVEKLEELYQATIEALAIAVDVKDQVTHGHIRRVQRHCLALADALGVTDEQEVKALAAAALLHDVGKLCVPDHVLNKPGALKAGEYHTMKQHAVQGATILSAVEFPYPVVPIVRHHHETWNGRGYPDGLRGEEIPFGARILAVIDCFDALTSDRPYRRKLTDEVALQMIRERSGSAYDPRVVERFLEIVPQLRRQDALAESATVTPRPGRAGAEAASLPRLIVGPVTSAAAANDTLRLAGSVASLFAIQQVGVPILTRLTDHVDKADACLFAMSPTGDHLIPAAMTAAAEVACRNNQFPIGSGLSGWVAAHRHTIINSDASLDFPDMAERLGFQSATSTPVFAFGTVAAVLTVYLPSRAACTDAVVRFIGILAQDVGVDLVSWEHSRKHQAAEPSVQRVRR